MMKTYDNTGELDLGGHNSGWGTGGIVPSRAIKMRATWVVPFSFEVLVFPSWKWDQAAAMEHRDPGFSHLLVCDFGSGYQA